MRRMFVAAIVLLQAPAVVPAEVRHLSYSGELLQRDRNGVGVRVASFEIAAFLDFSDGEKRLVSRIQETSRAPLPWFRRYGRAVIDARGNHTGYVPFFQHVHLDRTYRITIPDLVLAHPVPLKIGATWSGEYASRKYQFTVTGEKRRGARDGWEILATTATARQMQLLVEKETSQLITADVRVFVGQGDRYDLTIRLDGELTPRGDTLQKERIIREALITLQEKLEDRTDHPDQDFSPPEIKQIQAELPTLKTLAAGTSWETFVAEIATDVEQQSRRAKSLDELSAKFLGKTMPHVRLTLLDGSVVDLSTKRKAPVVLHFWEYRGEPDSPFGQVGYLDYLYSKRKQDGIQVYGISVDERLSDPDLLGKVRREVKRFSTEFMRLSYPVALDDGTLLKEFGDPRRLDAPLPLWVILGQDGSIKLYQSGLYDIDPNRGLTELDAELTHILSAKKE